MYYVYGLWIDSDFSLPGVAQVPGRGGLPDLRVHWRPPDDWPEGRFAGSAASVASSQPQMLDGHDGGFALVWGREVRCQISAACDEAWIYCRPDKKRYVSPLLVGVLLGYICCLRGCVCLHGAALEYDGRTLALLGHSGAGKSTLAAALVVQGYRLISDDVLVFSRPHRGELQLEVGGLGLRLEPGVALRLLGRRQQLPTVPYVNKLLWDLSSTAGLAATDPSSPGSSARRLQQVFVLQSSPSSSGSEIGPPLDGMSALQQLLCYWYPPHARKLLSPQHLEVLKVIAGTTSVQLVGNCRRFDQLGSTMELLA